MINPIQSFLKAGETIILDGALATQLEAKGLSLNDPLWSAKVLIEHPTMIQEVHRSYLEAGADIISTASYQATFEGFASRGIDRESSKALFTKSIDLAKAAIEEFWSKPKNRQGRQRPLIAASIGPYGAYLANGAEYTGEYDLDQEALLQFHLPRMEVLASGGVDFLLFETIPSYSEAMAILQALEKIPIPAMLSFSCKDEQHLADGTPISLAIDPLDSCDAIIAYGVNCGPPQRLVELLQGLGKQTKKPLLLYPNSGETWHSSSGNWLPAQEKHSSQDWVVDSLAAGAKIIGGCCRTGPTEIAQISASLRRK